MAAKKAARRSAARSRSRPPTRATKRTGRSPRKAQPVLRKKKPKTPRKQAKKPVARRRARAKQAAKPPHRPRRASQVKRPAGRRKVAVAARAGAPGLKKALKKPARKATARIAAPVAPPRRSKSPRVPRQAANVSLDRARRQLPEAEREGVDTDARLMSSVRAGGNDLQHLLTQHTESSPALTAGDMDANWGEAYAVGDEAPGGDNPTPDQDRVDDIGKALGVTYDTDEELQGSEKILERDRHRFELDPASADDWPHDS